MIYNIDEYQLYITASDNIFNIIDFYFDYYKQNNSRKENLIKFELEIIESFECCRTVAMGNRSSVSNYLFIGIANSYMIINEKMANAIIILSTLDSRNDGVLHNILCFFLTELVTRIQHFTGWNPLHASCIAYNGLAYIIAGHPGIGKTTTALKLLPKGFSFMSDDRPLVNSMGFARSFFRPLNISRDIIYKISCEFSFLKDIDVTLPSNKLRVSPISFSDYVIDNDIPIKKIIILNENTDESALNWHKLEKTQAAQKLLNISYHLLEKKEVDNYLAFCIQLATIIPIYTVDICYKDEWLDNLKMFLLDYGDFNE